MKPVFYNPLSWVQRKEMPSAILDQNFGRREIRLERAEDQARQGYGKSWVVYRCINLIARSAASVPRKLFVKERDGEIGPEIMRHPILDLIANPNPLAPGNLLWEADYAFKQLNGNSFLRVCTADRAGALPTELWNLEPQFTTIKQGNKIEPIEGYIYQRVGKKDPPIPSEEVSHDKMFNPQNPWFGQSPLQALALQVDHSNEGMAWNTAMLRNSAKPSGVLMLKGGVIADDQYDRWKERMEDETLGARSIGRPLLMSSGAGGAEWLEMGLSPRDMDWVNSTSVTTVQIAQGYDVPPELVGHDKSKTFANGRNARLTFWEDKVVPVANDKDTELNNWLVPMYPDGDRIVLKSDFSDVPVFRDVQDARFDRAKNADFLTVDERRKMAGAEPLGTAKGGDVILVPSTQIPLETFAAGGFTEDD